MNSRSPYPSVLHVLHLEDNAADAELIHAVLKKGWPDCRIERVQARAEYLDALGRAEYDLILSDFSLPGFDGLSALEIASRVQPGTPYIFLSGTIGEENAVRALQMGATDYVIKDRPGRLIPAIQRAMNEVREHGRRRRAEDQLRESQERFYQLAEQSSDVFWFRQLDPPKMLYVSPAFERIWGVPVQTLYEDARAWEYSVNPNDCARVIAAFADCVSGKKPSFEEEYRIRHSDGSERWILDSATPIRDDDGRMVRISGVARDISERRLSEQHIREQAELLAKARDAIIVSDLDNHIVYWNHGAERVFGWTAAEVMGRVGSDLFGVGVAERIKSVRAAVTNDEWHGEIQMTHKEGRLLDLDSTVTLIRDGEGKAKSYLVISTDITEKKEMEKQFLRSQRLESVGMLAGGIAHDLNNVLAPIVMGVDLMRQKIDDPDIRRLLDVLDTSAQHGAGLIRQVLAFSRGAEGERAVLQIQPAIRDVVKLLIETLPRSVAIETDLPTNVAPILSNSTQLGQILMNLCVNARDAMPDGGKLAIRASNVSVGEALAKAHPGTRPGSYVLLTVSDTGSGMPPALVERIFDPFFTTKGAGKGTGLGLSTVLGIVKNHGGFLQVQSEVGKGTEFRVFLPAALETSKASGGQAASRGIKRGNGERVLVIDDEESIRTMAQKLLEAGGFRAAVAEGGAQGLEAFKAGGDEIKVVVTDMMMPAMQGPEVIRRLREIDPEVRIVAMSGVLSDQSDMAKADKRIVLLQKPMTAKSFFDAIESLLRVP